MLASRPMSDVPRRVRTFFDVAAIFYLALALVGTVWLGLRHGQLGLELLVDPGGWWIDLGCGLGLGLVLVGGWRLWRWRSARARALEEELATLLAPLSRGEALGLALVSALGEEIFFRGALQGAIGWLPAAVVFALLHAGPGRNLRIWSLFALAAGLALGLYVQLRGALGGAIVAHLVVNGIHLVALSRRAPPTVPPSA